MVNTGVNTNEREIHHSPLFLRWKQWVNAAMDGLPEPRQYWRESTKMSPVDMRESPQLLRVHYCFANAREVLSPITVLATLKVQIFRR